MRDGRSLAIHPATQNIHDGKALSTFQNPNIDIVGVCRPLPDLSDLEIPLSSDPPESADVPHTPRTTQHSLTTLRVLESPIRAPFPVSAFLSPVFPALSYVSTAREEYFVGDDDPEPQDAEIHKRWKEVDRLVSLLVSVREED
ncbi:hypothetical protein B0H11DRAFT_2221601 [Mycena galericulata]|nr:hypothetical protein B0H11DRAFT_2221601 [Mycena galericulata]